MASQTTDKLGDRIWREVTQSSSTEEIARGVSDLLAEYLEHDRFVLVRLDADHRRAFVVEVVDREEASPESSDQDWTAGSDAAFDALVDWCREERTELARISDVGGDFDQICPWEPDTAALVASLPDEAEQIGFAAARITDADALDRELDLGAISEPLSAALYYDRGMSDAAAASVERAETETAHFQRVKRRELTDVVMNARTGLDDIADWARSVAPSDDPVLLIGEIGTGKEVVARTIHQNSRYADGPMLRVNCGALSDGVVETKLFGSGDDEFTPATPREPGWFERVGGGSLFLDEIDKLPVAAQERIVDWLETGRLQQPGGADPIDLDVRLMAGNHEDLEDAETLTDEFVEALTTFPVRIPPLRARPEEIPALAMAFAEKVGRRIGGAPLALGTEQIERLVDYDWPGNVRELRSVIERAAILGNGKRLHVDEALGESEEGATQSNGDDSVSTLEHAVRDHLLRALRATDGQVAGDGGAADLLDVHPSTLRSKLKKHDLDPDDYR